MCVVFTPFSLPWAFGPRGRCRPAPAGGGAAEVSAALQTQLGRLALCCRRPLALPLIKLVRRERGAASLSCPFGPV